MKAKVHAPPPPKPTLVLVPFADLCTPDLSDRVLIPDLIDQSTIVVVVGQPKSRKTFFVLDLTLHISLGWDWFGRRVQQGRVVYVAAEAGGTIRNRVAAFAMHHKVREPRNLTGSEKNTQADFSAVTSPVDLCHLGEGDDDVKRLVKAIGKADVVVIDTVSRALAGGDENSPADMGAFVRACDELRDQLGCTVIVVHHLGKDASRGGRGHSLLSCAADTIIEVEKKGGISLTKTVARRDGPDGGRIAFKLKPVELGRRDDHAEEVVMSCVVAEAVLPEEQPTGQKAALLAALDDAVAAHGVEIDEADGPAVTEDQWREQAKTSGRFEDSSFRTAWNRRKDLFDHELVGRCDNGGKTYCWPRGRFGQALPA